MSRNALTDDRLRACNARVDEVRCGARAQSAYLRAARTALLPAFADAHAHKHLTFEQGTRAALKAQPSQAALRGSTPAACTHLAAMTQAATIALKGNKCGETPTLCCICRSIHGRIIATLLFRSVPVEQCPVSQSKTAASFAPIAPDPGAAAAFNFEQAIHAQRLGPSHKLLRSRSTSMPQPTTSIASAEPRLRVVAVCLRHAS